MQSNFFIYAAKVKGWGQAAGRCRRKLKQKKWALWKYSYTNVKAGTASLMMSTKVGGEGRSIRISTVRSWRLLFVLLNWFKQAPTWQMTNSILITRGQKHNRAARKMNLLLPWQNFQIMIHTNSVLKRCIFWAALWLFHVSWRL